MVPPSTTAAAMGVSHAVSAAAGAAALLPLRSWNCRRCRVASSPPFFPSHRSHTAKTTSRVDPKTQFTI